MKYICMMCHKGPIEVRYINLYPSGSEGLFCCRDCENELLEFIREKSRKAVKEKIKNFRKKEVIIMTTEGRIKQLKKELKQADRKIGQLAIENHTLKDLKGLQKDLKEMDDRIAKMGDIGEDTFNDVPEYCGSCGKSMFEIADAESAAEVSITGYCMECQDVILGR